MEELEPETEDEKEKEKEEKQEVKVVDAGGDPEQIETKPEDIVASETASNIMVPDSSSSGQESVAIKDSAYMQVKAKASEVREQAKKAAEEELKKKMERSCSVQEFLDSRGWSLFLETATALHQVMAGASSGCQVTLATPWPWCVCLAV